MKDKKGVQEEEEEEKQRMKKEEWDGTCKISRWSWVFSACRCLGNREPLEKTCHVFHVALRFSYLYFLTIGLHHSMVQTRIMVAGHAQ